MATASRPAHWLTLIPIHSPIRATAPLLSSPSPAHPHYKPLLFTADAPFICVRTGKGGQDSIPTQSLSQEAPNALVGGWASIGLIRLRRAGAVVGQAGTSIYVAS